MRLAGSTRFAKQIDGLLGAETNSTVDVLLHVLDLGKVVDGAHDAQRFYGGAPGIGDGIVEQFGDCGGVGRVMGKSAASRRPNAGIRIVKKWCELGGPGIFVKEPQ